MKSALLTTSGQVLKHQKTERNWKRPCSATTAKLSFCEFFPTPPERRTRDRVTAPINTTIASTAAKTNLPSRFCSAVPRHNRIAPIRTASSNSRTELGRASTNMVSPSESRKISHRDFDKSRGEFLHLR